MPNIVAVFAHPDDESFGPGGTLAKLALDNNVDIICATSGDMGGSAECRESEIIASAKILGVRKVHFLRYGDGTLSNNDYHKLANNILTILDNLKPHKVITFEPRGISGHIDHIAISMITTYIYEKTSYINELWYYCISEAHRALIGDYFIYFPEGYSYDDVDEVVDVSEVWDARIKSVACHESQKKDMTNILRYLQSLPKEELFLVKRK